MVVFFAAITVGQHILATGLAASVQSVLAKAGTVVSSARLGILVAHCELGLWPGSSAACDAGLHTVVAGDPLMRTAVAALSRAEALRRLHHGLGPEGLALRDAEGTFCGLRVDLDRPSLQAFTDKLGVRPLYWGRDQGIVFVASAQWILDRLPQIPRRPDWQACAETAAFGYPLADRTPNLHVRVLHGGQILTAEAGASRIARWWDWTQIPAGGLHGEALVAAVRNSFDDAVAARLHSQRRVFSFLSGGMDSRLIVSSLRTQNAEVYSLNFAPAGSQDLELGRRIAQVLGSDHFEYGQSDDSFAVRRESALIAWRAAHPQQASWPEQGGLIWSGDGGSVGLGHVYMDPNIVAVARQDGPEAAAAAIAAANRLTLSKHMFRTASRSMATLPVRGIIEDLSSRRGVEPGRNAHLFFMLNDQRRHLAEHFEQVHRLGFDLVLPFFDGRFLATVLAAPVDEFIGHRLYNQLLLSSPDGSGDVPWQAYPGHEPCPLPAPEGLRRQWEDGWHDTGTERRNRRQRYRKSLAAAMSNRFPGQLLSRPVVLLAAVAGLAGFERFGYMTSALAPFMRATQRP